MQPSCRKYFKIFYRKVLEIITNEQANCNACITTGT